MMSRIKQRKPRREKKRLNSVIIFNNLPESNSQLKSNRIKHEKESVLELCTEVNKDFVYTYITEIHRLGEAKDGKTTPVLLTLSKNKKNVVSSGNSSTLKKARNFKTKIDHYKPKHEREE